MDNEGGLGGGWNKVWHKESCEIAKYDKDVLFFLFFFVFSSTSSIVFCSFFFYVDKKRDSSSQTDWRG